MNSEVRRWDISARCDCGEGTVSEVTPHGDWVEARNYDSILAGFQAERKKFLGAVVDCDVKQSVIVQLRADVEALRAECRAGRAFVENIRAACHRKKSDDTTADAYVNARAATDARGLLDGATKGDGNA